MTHHSLGPVRRAGAALRSAFYLVLTVLGASAAQFDIPAQTAPEALKVFSKQSGTRVVYIFDELKSIRKDRKDLAQQSLAAE